MRKKGKKEGGGEVMGMGGEGGGERVVKMWMSLGGIRQ